MFENEVIISETDKDTILYHIKQVNEILNKYPYQSNNHGCCGNISTNMSRAKTAAQNAEKWIENLYT